MSDKETPKYEPVQVDDLKIGDTIRFDGFDRYIDELVVTEEGVLVATSGGKRFGGVPYEVMRLCKPETQKSQSIEGKGKDKLWGWFGLSYANWLTLSRPMMGHMPDEWQSRMANLLDEFDEFYPNPPDLETRVQVVKGGKFISPPSYLTSYRYPQISKLEEMMNKPESPSEEGG